MLDADATTTAVAPEEDEELDDTEVAALLDEAEPAAYERSPDLDTLGAYLNGVGQYALLSAEREVELAKAIEAGERAEKRIQTRVKRDVHQRRKDERLRKAGEAAREEMINANLRLVIAMARKYRWTGLPLLDLIQEGNIGLMRGVVKFDWRKGFKFSTYATWWIRQAIQRGIADRSRVIRLPVHVHELLLQISRAKISLESELGREATDAEIAERAWIPYDRVRELRRMGTYVLSLETPVGKEGDATLGEFVPDENAGARFDDVLAGISHDEAMKVVATLNQREQMIIAMRFGLTGEEPRTLEEVGKMFSLTRERIRQLEAKALAKLRHPSRSAALRIET
ncbi:MAG: sigma-70 family RNA polymerase sigma factor [Actinomycetota bacterium]